MKSVIRQTHDGERSRTIFFGTSQFGAIILERLFRAHIVPLLVVTTPDKPAGRKQLLTPPPVKVTAQEFGIPVIQPEKLDQDTRYKIQDTNPDLIIVASYGKILPQELLDVPKQGSLNVHPSLLPMYRGSAPVQAALLNGDEKTGVTIMLMDEKMDHGMILVQTEFPIGNVLFAYPELHDKLAEIGGDLLAKTIPLWVAGKIRATPQDDSKATYTRQLIKEDGRIDWSKPAVYIERQVRALQPWPGTFCKIKAQSQKSKNTKQNLKILKADVIENMQGQPGKTFLAPGKKLGVYTGNGALLIEELQLEGKKPVSSKEFLLGHKDILNNKLPN